MIYTCTKSSRHSVCAFSLVEVLVAVTILLLVAVAPLTIISRANSSTAFASETLVAFFIAQSGLELVQKQRDDLLLAFMLEQFNLLGGSGRTRISNPMTRFTGLGSPVGTASGDAPVAPCYRSNGCAITFPSTVDISFYPCATNPTNCRIYRSGASGVEFREFQYVQAPAQPAGSVLTPYTRVIRMERVMDGTKMRSVKVTSTVTWRTGSLLAGQKVELVTYLTNSYDIP